MEKLYTVDEVWESGILPWKNKITFYRKLQAGKIRATLIDRRWYIRAGDIEEYLNRYFKPIIKAEEGDDDD